MLGRISQDLFIIDRMLPQESPYAAAMVDPAFRKQNFLLPVMGSPKLDNLYNTGNMPVIFTRAGQENAFQMRQGGVKNVGLSTVAFPRRMPYLTT